MSKVIKIVGEDWCPFTKGTADKKGAWLAAEELTGWDANTEKTGEQGSKKIVYEVLDCADAKTKGTCSDTTKTTEADCVGTSATWTPHTDYTKYCQQAQGYPSFMDDQGTLCARGFDPSAGFAGVCSDATKTTEADCVGQDVTWTKGITQKIEESSCISPVAE